MDGSHRHTMQPNDFDKNHASEKWKPVSTIACLIAPRKCIVWEYNKKTLR